MPKKYKVVLLGDQAVGKSSIIKAYGDQEFNPDTDVVFGLLKPTVGVDFVMKSVRVGARTIKLQIWDTAGQERFRSLIPSYIKDCIIAIVVYDITSRSR
jgi:small GTP-binding protein